MFKNVSIIGVTNEEQTCKFSLICSFGDKMVTHLVWFDFIFTYTIKFFIYKIFRIWDQLCRNIGLAPSYTITNSMVGTWQLAVRLWTLWSRKVTMGVEEALEEKFQLNHDQLNSGSF